MVLVVFVRCNYVIYVVHWRVFELTAMWNMVFSRVLTNVKVIEMGVYEMSKQN